MMKSLRFVALFVLMFGGGSALIPAHEQIRPTDLPPPEQRLNAIQQELMDAWIARDRAKIEGFLAPDWLVTGPTYAGTVYTAEIRFTDTFERHGGDWRAVRSHASNISK